MAKSPRVKSLSTKPSKFADQARVVLAGSEKAPAPNAIPLKATPAKSKVTVVGHRETQRAAEDQPAGRPGERAGSCEPD